MSSQLFSTNYTSWRLWVRNCCSCKEWTTISPKTWTRFTWTTSKFTQENRRLTKQYMRSLCKISWKRKILKEQRRSCIQKWWTTSRIGLTGKRSTSGDKTLKMLGLKLIKIYSTIRRIILLTRVSRNISNGLVVHVE